MSVIKYRCVTCEMFIAKCQHNDDNQLKENNLIYNVYIIIRWWKCTHDEVSDEMINTVIWVCWWIHIIQSYVIMEKKFGQDIVPTSSSPIVKIQKNIQAGRWKYRLAY